MKNFIYRKKHFLILLLPLGFLISRIASFFPRFTETVYSNSIYKFFSQILSTITGVLPFSLGEILFITIVLLIVSWFVKLILLLFKNFTNFKCFLIKSLQNILITISIVYFVFIIMWGLNYSRLPFAETANLEVKNSSVTDLKKLCESLVIKTNELRAFLNEDSNGVMYIPENYSNLSKRAKIGYKNASKIYPQLDGNYGRTKGVFISNIMSYMGISGIYSPFTGEANVNVNIPQSMLPVTISHEMAHQYGFAREDEANFIAYLTCSMHTDIDFQYSGNVLALIQSMNILYEYDTEGYLELSNMYSEGLKRDLIYISIFWQQYSGPIEKASSKLNDTYLKSNQQKDGVNSYGRMVNLLLANFKKNNTLNN